MKYVPLSYIDSAPPDSSVSSDFKKVVQWKFDTVFTVWENCTISDVCGYFSIINLIEGFWTDAAPVISRVQYGNVVRFVFNHIMFELKLFEFQSALKWLEVPDEDRNLSMIMDYEFSHIRVAMQGKALDFLRNEGIDVESLLCCQHPNMHVTRVDVAFDFFNYGNEFLTDLVRFLSRRADNLTPAGLVSVAGMQRGLNFEMKNGSRETTVYLGASGSSRYLRIYDKYKERVNAGRGMFKEVIRYQPSEDSSPEVLPVSTWLRFEWQLRDAYAMEILYSGYTGSYGACVLKKLWDYYQVRSARSVKPARFWTAFFDPSNYEGNLYKTLILYNSESSYLLNQQKLKNFVSLRMNRILAYVLINNDPNILYSDCVSYLNWLQTPLDDEIDDAIRLASLSKLTKLLSEMSPTGRLDDVVTLSADRQLILFPAGGAE